MWKVVTAVAMLASSPAYEQHQTYQGTGVVCDTPEQVARYVRSNEGDGTLAAINAEKPHSCAIMKVAFFIGQTGEKITTPSGTWQITKILIVGVDVGEGIQAVQPTVQWSAFQPQEEQGASLPLTLATWKPEYAQNAPEINRWYKDAQMNEATWERLGKPSWKGCCEKGDVFKTQFRVGEDRSDQWFYLTKEGTWKQVPPDTIHWGQHAPNGLPTLFVYWTGQELCFYPPEEGI